MKRKTLNLLGDVIFAIGIIGLLTSIYGCKQADHNLIDKNISIDLDNNPSDSLAFSLFVDSMTSIPLETTDDCLLGSIRDVIITDSFLLVLPEEPKAIYCFNRSGKYLRKIARKGNGPGEYPFINQFSYNKYRNSISVVGTKVIEYDLYGNCKNEFNLGHYAMNDLLLLVDGGYILSRLNDPETPEGVIRVDSTGQSKEVIYTRNPEYKIRSSIPKELINVNGNLRFITPQIENTIYSWGNEKLQTEITLNIYPEVSKDFYENKPKVWGLGENYYRSIYQESEKWILLCYWSEVKGTRFLVYNKETNKYFVGKKLWNDIDGTKSPHFLSASTDNTFTNYRKSTNPEDNPVIQILHLKN